MQLCKNPTQVGTEALSKYYCLDCQVIIIIRLFKPVTSQACALEPINQDI